MNSKSIVFNLSGWVFGALVFVTGVINMFWGNDLWFGVFLAGLSFVYFPVVNGFVRERVGLSVPLFAKIALGLFIVWAAIGVGELFPKIGLMLKDLH